MNATTRALMSSVLVALPMAASASSHREAPAIADDPAADNTDVYAWVTPGSHDNLHIVANYIPLEEPSGGPNFHRFSEQTVESTGMEATSSADMSIVVVTARDMGIGRCPAVLIVPAPIAPDVGGGQCEGMTSDGATAVITIEHENSMDKDSAPTAAPQVFGAAAKRTVEALKGLVECSPAKSVGGVPIELVGDLHHRIVVKRRGQPPLVVDRLTMGRHDGECHEALEDAYQLPNGPVVFGVIRNEDTGLSETRVRIWTERSLGAWCGPPPKPAK